MEHLVKDWLKHLGENPDREGLKDTPRRVAEAWEYLTLGYKQDPAELLQSAVFTVDANHMIIVRDIEIYSLCEHHMLPFFGRCYIGYIPNGRVVGLSKLARVADVFARRLQLQERMTNQIAETIMEAIEPDGVGVVIEARHLCMMMRGVSKQNSSMVTSAMLGSFRDSIATRNEFLQLLKGSLPET
jgi:GTP cyclohydrolase I